MEGALATEALATNTLASSSETLSGVSNINLSGVSLLATGNAPASVGNSDVTLDNFNLSSSGLVYTIRSLARNPNRGGLLWGRYPLGNAPAVYWSQVTSVIGENNLSANIDGGKVISWDKPTLQGDGSVIPASTITGYAIYKKGSEERYSVVTQWSGGQSGLSDPQSTTTWKSNIEPPNGTNTFTSDDSLSSINAYINTRTAGDVVYFSDTGVTNAGVFLLTGDNGLINVNVNGNSNFDSEYITIMAVPGENPVFQGEHDGSGTTPVTNTNQTIIHVTGDYIRLYGLESYRSNRYAIRLEGNSPHVEETYSHENYSSGIIAGFNGTNNNGLIQYNLVERSLTFPGIIFRYDDGSDTFNVDGWVVRRNISIRNGFTITNTDVDTSGNADGFMVFKDFHAVFDARVAGGGARDGNTEGRWNASKDFLFSENITYYNTDDGFDESTGTGLFIGNIAMNNGPRGNRGFKVFTNDYGHFEEVNYLGNIAIHQNPNGAASSSSVGFELQTNSDGGFGPTPTKDGVANTALHNDNGSGGTARGITIESNPSGKFYNNLSKGNNETLTGTFDQQSNYLNSELADPDITDFTYKLVDENLLGSFGVVTVHQIWLQKYREIKAKVMPTQNGNLYGLGVLDAVHYSPTANDNTNTPADPDNYTQLKWYGLDKSSKLPDIGASQYEFIQAPINVEIN